MELIFKLEIKTKENHMKNKVLALAIGCMSLTAKAESVVEPLMGHFVTQGGIQIQVKSGGCTWKKHFEVNRELRDGRIILTFMRKIPDPCRAYIPYGEILTFSFEELGLNTGDVYEMGNGEAPMRVARH
jgi:hypothetical protein